MCVCVCACVCVVCLLLFFFVYGPQKEKKEIFQNEWVHKEIYMLRNHYSIAL